MSRRSNRSRKTRISSSSSVLKRTSMQRHLAEERKRAEENEESSDGNDGGNDGPANRGKLIVDAICAPADIAYPTDIGLLNDVREKTERIIDFTALFLSTIKKHKP